jgi:hypothetical protein
MTDFYPQITVTSTPEPPREETTPKQAQITPHPPNRVDVILALMDEVERLKQIREDVVTGQRQADNILKAEMYITQLGLSAYKIILDGLKEAAKIQLIQNNQTTNEVNVKVDVKPMLAEYEQLFTATTRTKTEHICTDNTTKQVHPTQANSEASPIPVTG